jgi:uncharacterized membrane protein YheB (UPF0754 family)
MNMSLASNLFCILLILLGYIAPPALRPHLVETGFFGFSGAITNWIAVYMLFERVPGLYGSGIIPLKFESFKTAIRDMIMNQFFTLDNINKFTQSNAESKLNLVPIIETLDYNPIFDGFVDVILKSKFGGMLGMFGGAGAIEPMREPFITKLREKLTELVSQPGFLKRLTAGSGTEVHQALQEKISAMVDHRLSELTPKMVKEIIEKMIHSHLGWLVVWGAVFGCVIGLISSFLPK